jgi:hypothetical protein
VSGRSLTGCVRLFASDWLTGRLMPSLFQRRHPYTASTAAVKKKISVPGRGHASPLPFARCGPDAFQRHCGYVHLTKPKLLLWERPSGRDWWRERLRERSVTPRLAGTLGPPAFPIQSRAEARSHKEFCLAL